MKLLRNIALDLWDQTLWPFVVVLVAAIAAVPLLLGGPGEPVPAGAPGVVAGTQAAAVIAAPSTSTGAPGVVRARGGALRDPFARERVKPLARTPKEAAGGAEAPGTSTPASPPLDDLVLPPLPSPEPPGTGTGAPAAEPGDVVTVRVGRAGDLALRGDVAVRTPLPSVGDPFLVYLGNKPDGRSAQFLVSSDAVPTGDGECRPSPESCEEIVMTAGETEFFDVTAPDGEVVQYQLDVVRVGPRDE